MKLAVVTAMGAAPEEALAACIASVQAQTFAATHYLCGRMRGDCAGVQMIDLGDQPISVMAARFAGAMSALNLGYEAVAFLDPGFVYAPEHLEACAGLLGTAQVVLSRVAAGEPGDNASGWFIAAGAAHLPATWGVLPNSLAGHDARFMRAWLKHKKTVAAINPHASVSWQGEGDPPLPTTRPPDATPELLQARLGIPFVWPA